MARSRTAALIPQSSANIADTALNSKASGSSEDQNNTIEAEPKRKRRIASLNAEFLVHYTSKSNSQQPADLKSKRKRSVSDNSVSTTARNQPKKRGRQSNENSSSCTVSVANKSQKSARKQTKKQKLHDEEDQMNHEQKLAHEELIENYEKIINDFAVHESNDDEEYEPIKATSKKQPPKSAKKPKKPKTKDPEAPTPPLTPQTGRPKREASLRASAMIIQTNEIEKTKYQYHFSNSNPATPTAAPEPILSPSSESHHRLKHSHSFSSFQVPQFSSTVYASLTAAAAVAAQAAAKPNTATKKRNPKPLRHISTTTTLGAISQAPVFSCQDEDSNDVLIIESPIRSRTLASKGKDTDKIYPLLTEEVMKEHNRIDEAGSSSGSGAFSNFTRDYIIKWVSQYKLTDEMPFAPGQIPIESYGVKILNEPQYLTVKSRQENGNISPKHIQAVSKPSMSHANSLTQLNTPPPPNKRLAEAISVKAKILNDCEPAAQDMKCLNNSNDDLKRLNLIKKVRLDKSNEQSAKIESNLSNGNVPNNSLGFFPSNTKCISAL